MATLSIQGGQTSPLPHSFDAVALLQNNNHQIVPLFASK
jgi:hypothetical protein